jgi:hypothetical protein
MTSGVYRILNLQTKSAYVGSAVNVDARWRSHKHSLRHLKKSPPKLQRAWDKYGEQAFVFEVLLRCAVKDLLSYEQRAIDALRPNYNTRLTAESNLGVRWSEETNAKKRVRHEVHVVRGVRGSISSLARYFGAVGRHVAVHRVSRGWAVEDAVTLLPESKQDTGAKTARRHAANGTHPRHKFETFDGVTAPVRALVERFSIVSYSCVIRRRALGWSLESALTTPKRDS